MDIRERLEAFWLGERPDQIPYTIYQNEWRHTADDPAWQELFQKGLGVIRWRSSRHRNPRLTGNRQAWPGFFNKICLHLMEKGPAFD